MATAPLITLVVILPFCAILGWWIGGRISKADLDRRADEKK